MFYLRNKSITRKVGALADAVVEFSTLGEYRLVIEEAVVSSAQSDLTDIWALEVEWPTATRSRTPASCSLPRSHDRGTALAFAS
ncbi:MAG: hypothetical protein JHC87_08030 [Thermoleophilaceae bacterium]|nr:hypothetical protein [Thermoleophilaceae bacterium]